MIDVLVRGFRGSRYGLVAWRMQLAALRAAADPLEELTALSRRSSAVVAAPR